MEKFQIEATRESLEAILNLGYKFKYSTDPLIAINNDTVYLVDGKEFDWVSTRTMEDKEYYPLAIIEDGIIFVPSIEAKGEDNSEELNDFDNIEEDKINYFECSYQDDDTSNEYLFEVPEDVEIYAIKSKSDLIVGAYFEDDTWYSTSWDIDGVNENCECLNLIPIKQEWWKFEENFPAWVSKEREDGIQFHIVYNKEYYLENLEPLGYDIASDEELLSIKHYTVS